MDSAKLTTISLGLTMLLGGCLAGLGPTGSSADPDTSTSASPAAAKVIQAGEPLTGTVRFFAYVDITREPSDGSQEMEARFGRFDADVPADVIVKAFSLEKPDTCERSSRTERLEVIDELAFPGYPYQFVDAGDAIAVRHKGQRYASLSRRGREDGPEYETAMSGASATFAKIKLFDVFVKTSELTVWIPGADFPTVGPLKVPDVSDVKGLNLDPEDRVRADTVFEWEVGDNPDALVQISAGGGGRAVFCAAIDDGEFALPADIQQWLGDKSIPNPEAHREAVVFYQTKDAVIAVTQSTQY